MKKNSERQTIEYPLYISLLRYFEFYEERVSQRNVTKNVSTCCQGYITTTENCLLSKYTIIKQARRLIFTHFPPQQQQENRTLHKQQKKNLLKRVVTYSQAPASLQMHKVLFIPPNRSGNTLPSQRFRQRLHICRSCCNPATDAVGVHCYSLSLAL